MFLILDLLALKILEHSLFPLLPIRRSMGKAGGDNMYRIYGHHRYGGIRFG